MTNSQISLPYPEINYAALYELTKPRITLMVVIMCAAGFVLGSHRSVSYIGLLWAVLGSGLSSAGAAVLNNYLERDSDALMHRTKNRGIPTGEIAPEEALGFGLCLVLSGVFLLTCQVNLITGFISLLTVFLYVLVYTPLKKVTWLNTLIGAIPGALPPLGGWCAATGGLDVGAWLLFAILFVWQQPHFYAIALMHCEDYRRGGFKMLPVVEPDGASTMRQIIFFSIVLIPVSCLPTFFGMASWVYAFGMLLLGIFMLYTGWVLSKSGSRRDAVTVLKTSIIYLPCFFALILLDSWWA